MPIAHPYTLSIHMTTTHTTPRPPASALPSRLLDGCCIGCATAGIVLAIHLGADECAARDADASRATLAPIMRITSYVGDAGDMGKMSDMGEARLPAARNRAVKPVR